MITIEKTRELNRIIKLFQAPKSWKKTTVILRGKEFDVRKLEIMTRCVNEHFNSGRTKISRVICEQLNWKQPNGWLKDRACRDVLRQLEKKGLFSLPPSKVVHSKSVLAKKDHLTEYDFDTPLTQFPRKISLRFAKGGRDEMIWNQLVDRYHYLGHKVIVGQCIKYLIEADERIVGAIAFSSPAWQLSSRQAYLKCILNESIDDIVIINNSRFLILPFVQVKNLASAVLAAATKRIVSDWAQYYCTVPQVVETFVAPSRFAGTCYRAANWIEIGYTRGYAKCGTSHYNSQEPKQIFVYGLNKSIRRRMSVPVQD